MKDGNWDGYVYEHRYIVELWSKKDHLKLHNWINNGCKINASASINVLTECFICGAILDSSHSRYCSIECANKHKRMLPNKPSKDVLANDLTNIRNKSKIAIKYNVTRTSINRWIKFYKI